MAFDEYGDSSIARAARSLYEETKHSLAETLKRAREERDKAEKSAEEASQLAARKCADYAALDRAYGALTNHENDEVNVRSVY